MNQKSNRTRSLPQVRTPIESSPVAIQADSNLEHPAWQQGRRAMPDRIQLPGSLQDRPPAWRRPTLSDQISRLATRCQYNRFAGDQRIWYTDPERFDVCRTVTCGPDWPAGPEWPMIESVVHYPCNHRFISAHRERLIPLKRFAHTIRRTTGCSRCAANTYYIQ